MKRKITSVIAAVLVGSMIIGSTAFAADSSTTSNTETTTITSPVETQEAKEGKTMFAVPNAAGEGTATVDNVRVTVNYTECTLPNAIETAVTAPADAGATQALNEYVAANFAGRKVVARAKFRLYKAGQSVNDGFGTLKQTIGVGNAYDGQTVQVIQHHLDGTITVIEVPVVNGKVSFNVTDLGTFFVLL